jgi:hypothetical protein
MTHPTFRIMMNQEHKFKKVAKGGSMQRRFHIQCTFYYFKKWLFVFACINVGAMFHAFEYLRY